MMRGEFANVLIAQGYKPFDDFQVSVHSDGRCTFDWYHTDVQPSEASLQAILDGNAALPSGKSFADWLAEHCGDKSITRTQARLALHRAGLLVAIDAAVRAAGVEAEILYDSPVWHRHNPLIESLGTAVGLSASAIDDLFTSAGAIE